MVMNKAPKIQKIAFIGDHLPRKCGIATFTSDLLTAVAAEYPQTECFAVPVNAREGGYEYMDVVRFEVEELQRHVWSIPRRSKGQSGATGEATANPCHS